MEFRVLGPLEVHEDGHALALGGHKQRAALALLCRSCGSCSSRIARAVLLAEAVGGYRALGMDSWAERAEPLLTSPT